MKKKLLNVYLNVFFLFVFISSAICAYKIIDKLDLPKGIISLVVNYGYFALHIFSFALMDHYRDMLWKSDEK